jgi:hypothetical protein
MSDDEKKEGGGWLQTLGNGATWLGSKAHAGVEAIEGAKATKEVVEGAEGVAKSFAGTGIELTPELEAAASGAPSLGQTVAQARYAAGSGEGILGTAGQALAPLALASGVMEGHESIKDMGEHGANLENTPNLVKAGLETTAGGVGTLGLAGTLLSAAGATTAGAGATAAAAAAAPVAMVAGAGAAGMAVGDGMAHAADSSYTKTGAWGKDDSGNNKSAMDWGSGWGTWVDTHTGDKNAANPSILGGVAAGAGGIVGGVAGTAQAGWNALSSLW